MTTKCQIHRIQQRKEVTQNTHIYTRKITSFDTTSNVVYLSCCPDNTVRIKVVVLLFLIHFL